MSRRTRAAWTILTWGIVITSTAAMLWLFRPLPAFMPPTRIAATWPSLRPVAKPLGLDQLAVIWKRDLRQSVDDAKPALPPAPKLETPPALTLVGTAIESNRPFAIFQKNAEPTLVRGPGERIDDFEILAISRGRARLRQRGREFELRMPGYEKLSRE